MSMPIDKLPQSISGYFNCKNEVTACDRCKGIGTYTTEELGDYHKREYYTQRHTCNQCKGDGRIVIQKEYLSFSINERTTRIPYTDFKGDPHLCESQAIRYKLDHRNQYLEKKFPELAALTYDEYDKLIEKFKTFEALKKDHT
jgi:hypothetical protein